jgi:hypothetical protein
MAKISICPSQFSEPLRRWKLCLLCVSLILTASIIKFRKRVRRRPASFSGNTPEFSKRRQDRTEQDCCTHSLLHAQQDALTQYKDENLRQNSRHRTRISYLRKGSRIVKATLPHSKMDAKKTVSSYIKIPLKCRLKNGRSAGNGAYRGRGLLREWWLVASRPKVSFWAPVAKNMDGSL